METLNHQKGGRIWLTLLVWSIVIQRSSRDTWSFFCSAALPKMTLCHPRPTLLAAAASARYVLVGPVFTRTHRDLFWRDRVILQTCVASTRENFGVKPEQKVDINEIKNLPATMFTSLDANPSKRIWIYRSPVIGARGYAVTWKRNVFSLDTAHRHVTKGSTWYLHR